MVCLGAENEPEDASASADTKNKRKDKIHNMKIIAGLGNPTDQYKGTRHNVGFMAIDRLSEAEGIAVNQHKHKAMTGSGFIGGQRVLLMKPLTYMNLSGESIRAAADFYKVEPEDILIIYDDISLEPGMLRIRKKGSAGGHNGIKSIIKHLGCDTFPRIRVGIGGEKHPGQDLADYVLPTSSPELQFRSGATSSRLAALFVVDVLFTTLCNKNYSTVAKPLAESYSQCSKHHLC